MTIFTLRGNSGNPTLHCSFSISRIFARPFRHHHVAIALFLLALVSPGFTWADSLSGRILDPQGAVTPDAQVSLYDRSTGEQRHTTSVGEGRYTFTGLPAGDYLLETTAADSALIASQQISVKGDTQTDITLKVAAVQTEIAITASSTPLALTEVAKALDVVTADQLAVRDTFLISEAVRSLPGVRVQTLEGPGSLTTIQTRGMRAVDTAVLIDGMRFQDPGSPQNDATAFLQDLTVVDTDRVEFLRGSGSSLYGSNAMAGVLNIGSRVGGGPTHGEVLGEGGGLGMIRSVVSVGGGGDDNRLSYSGAISHLNVTRGVRAKNPYRNSNGQGALRYSITPRITVTGRVWGNSAYATSNENPTVFPVLANSASSGFVPAIPLPESQLALFEAGQSFNAGNATYIPSQIDPDARRISSFVNDVFTLQQIVSPMTTYRVSYQGVHTRRAYLDGPAGPGSFEPFSTGKSHFNGKTDTIQGRLDQRLGQHNFLTAGYDFGAQEYSSFDEAPVSAAPSSQLTLKQHTHAFYGQNQIRLFGGQLQITVGGRAQLFRLKQPAFSGGAANPYQGPLATIQTPNAYTGDGSVAYFAQRSNTKFRIHGGNSYREPSAYERFGGDATAAFVYGDPGLKPERSVAIDAGIDQWLWNSKARISGTWFYTELQEVILFANSLPVSDPFGRFFGYANGGGGISRGVELSATVSPVKSTTIQTSYTFTNSDSATPTVAPGYHNVLGLSPHVFTLNVTQWVGPRLHTAFSLYNASDYVNTIFDGGSRIFKFNGPTKADLSFGYDVSVNDRTTVEVYGKIENLFNQQSYEDGFIGPKAWAIAGLRLKY